MTLDMDPGDWVVVAAEQQWASGTSGDPATVT